MKGLRVLVVLVALCSFVTLAASQETSLRFYGHVTLSAAGTSSCTQTSQGVLDCTVPEGAHGTVVLTVTVSPSQTVSITATSVPAGWNSLGTSGVGTLNASYAFRIPSGAAGSVFVLGFRATAGSVHIDLQVNLHVSAGDTSTATFSTNPLSFLVGTPGQPDSTDEGAVSSATDTEGRFIVSLPGMNTTVSGTLSVCGGKPLADQTFTVTPTASGGPAHAPAEIEGFSFAAAGYDAADVVHFSHLSLFGLSNFDVGDVCMNPTAAEAGRVSAVDCPAPEPGFVLVGYTLVRNYVCVDAWGEDEPTEGGYAYLHSVTVTKNGQVTSDEILYCVYNPVPYDCPDPEPGYRLAGYTYVKDYQVVDFWGENTPSPEGYIHVKSRSRVENGATLSDEIWSCVYEPE